jgi:hypothetical protein
VCYAGLLTIFLTVDYSLAQEMSFVSLYLSYFRQQLITHPLSALLPFQSLLTESLLGDQLLASLHFSGVLIAPCPLCCMFLFSSLFIIQFLFFFLEGMGQSVQGAMLVYPRGSCGNTLSRLFAHLLVCVSQAGLELASGSAGALLFSSVTWHGEALYGLGIQGVRILILLGGIFSA